MSVESELRERLRGLMALSQALAAATEPEEVIGRILEAGTRLFRSEGCSVAVVDETTQELHFFAMEGRAKAPPFRIPPGQGIAGHVVRTGETVLVNDTTKDARFFQGVDRKTGFQTRSILCAPLRWRGATLGTIQAVNARRIEGFGEEDAEVLVALSSLVGAAISRTRAESAARAAGTVLAAESEARHRMVTGRTPAMVEALRVLKTAAASPATVLLLGESGTGKEVCARQVHQWSPRHRAPFVAINCVALTPTLLESELFGHEKGAFTGATARKKGKFELADGGTLFLDEIGELPAELQSKLLRVLQEREFERVGGTETLRVDVRLLAATNRDLRAEVNAGRFREDLYYRLNVVQVSLPPLRARPDDIAALAEHFLVRACQDMKRPALRLSAEAHEAMRHHPWPGNVRELANLIERCAVLAPGPEVSVADLALDAFAPSGPGKMAASASGRGHPAPRRGSPAVTSADIEATVPADLPLGDAVDAFKRRRVQSALEACGGNQARAAVMLGMAPPNLNRMLKTLGLRV
jgi:Nif-specific regulatory protein